MLQRGQTTEQRIAEIANRFGQGLSSYGQSQMQQAELINRENEIAARKRALGIDIEGKLTEQTGRNLIGSGIGDRILRGDSMSRINLEEFPLSRSQTKENNALARQKEMDDIDKLYKQSQINKNNAEAKKKSDPRNASLPLENKTTVQTLAKKNADAEYIANQIESFLENSKNYSEDQIFTQGNQLIKTLNSTISSDAAGAEEVKRLAGKLNFALGNFTNDNPTQFGRDLPGFLQQARDTAAIMRGGISQNKKIIDQQYGGRSTQGSNTAPSGSPPSVGTVDSGYVFLGGNPADPSSWQKARE